MKTKLLWLRVTSRALFLIVLSLCWVYPAYSEPVADRTERLAIISAFEPEITALLSRVQDAKTDRVNGVTFTTGVLEGHPVVLFLSGVSMVNAAMNTQLALDRYAISHIIFSGIAGGVNPALHIGDVVVAEQWGQYLEVLMARETGIDHFNSTGKDDSIIRPGFGMMFTRSVKVRSNAHPDPVKRFWFPVDAKMLAVAKTLTPVELASCDQQKQCLAKTPRLVVGGNGVSGSAFLDNAALREHIYKVFEANVVDMESAACAQVAYSNGVPFIAFRSLSDLAGGGEGANEMHTFLALAAHNSTMVLLQFLRAWP